METEIIKRRGRPPKAQAGVVEHAEPIEYPIIKEEKFGPTKLLAKSVILGIGVDLLGSKLSLQAARGNALEVTPLGVKATGKTGRVVLVPWSNIRGVELFPEA